MGAKKQVRRKSDDSAKSSISAKQQFEQLQDEKKTEHQRLITHRRFLVGEYLIMGYSRTMIPAQLFKDHLIEIGQRQVDQDIAEIKKARLVNMQKMQKSFSMDDHWREALENCEKILRKAWEIVNNPGDGTGTAAQALKIVDEQWERRRMCLAALGVKASATESESQKKNFLIIGMPGVGDSIRTNEDGSITFIKG